MTQQREILGLCGKAGSGKTTIRQALCRLYDVESLPMASTLKEFVLAVYPALTDKHVYGPLKDTILPVYGKSGRQLLQEIGTDLMRAYDPDIWLRPIVQRIEAWPNRSFIIDDVRFENEAAMIRKMGGHIIHVRRVSQGFVDPHVSEAGVQVGSNDSVIFNGESSALDFESHALAQYTLKWKERVNDRR